MARAAAELESTVACYQEYLAAEQALADTQVFLKEEAAGGGWPGTSSCAWPVACHLSPRCQVQIGMTACQHVRTLVQ